MKKALFVVALLALSVFAPLCFARLNETEAACAQRYGKPESEGTEKPNEPKCNHYRSNGILIHIWFLKGRAARIDFDSKLSSSDLDVLLEANSQGRRWHYEGYKDAWLRWTRDDGTIASYRKDYGEKLVMQTPEYTLYEKAKENPKMQGF
jgi:hypothetical protein